MATALSSLPCSSLAMEREALFIQKIIQVTNATAMIDMIAAEALLRLEGEVRRGELQQRPDGHAQPDGEADPGPDEADVALSSGPDEVGHEDADHESGLEAFAQSDEVVAEHGSKGKAYLTFGKPRAAAPIHVVS